MAADLPGIGPARAKLLRDKKLNVFGNTPMAQTAMLSAEPACERPPIDRTHLKQMTFGDRSLERELLQLFDRQAEQLMVRMRTSDAAVLAMLAHTLKGSALGIGANDVARAAGAAEAAAGSPPQRMAALDGLAAAIDAARGEIAALLRV
jgi:HPt (histidine-containing phosphotransfer) domain-containing protein